MWLLAVKFEHVGKLAGYDGVVAAIRAAGDCRDLVDEQLGATGGAVERAQVVGFRRTPFRLGDVVLNRIAGQLGLRGLHMHRLACRCGRSRNLALSDFVLAVSRYLGIGLFLLGGVEFLDFLRGKQR